MYETGAPFPSYSSVDQDELAKKRAAKDAALLTAQENELRTSLGEKFAQPAADATTRGIGNLAIQSLTGGILEASYKNDNSENHEITSVTPEQARTFGGVSLRDYMLRDATPVIVTDADILGHAERRQAA